MNEFEKGYVAGIIDGEGTVSLVRIHASDKFRAPNVEVTSTTYEILEKLKEICNGGTICKVTKREEHYKQAYKWNIRYDKAIDVLKEVSDFLLEPSKKARAKFIIEVYKNVTPRNGKYSEEKLKAKMAFEEKFFTL